MVPCYQRSDDQYCHWPHFRSKQATWYTTRSPRCCTHTAPALYPLLSVSYPRYPYCTYRTCTLPVVQVKYRPVEFVYSSCTYCTHCVWTLPTGYGTCTIPAHTVALVRSGRQAPAICFHHQPPANKSNQHCGVFVCNCLLISGKYWVHILFCFESNDTYKIK